MTTGSWSTLTTSYAMTMCSGTSSFRNGTQVSWTGADRVVKRKSKQEYREWKIHYLLQPYTKAYDRHRGTYKINHKLTSEMFDSQGLNIFDLSRERRMKAYGPIPSQGDYYTPHAFSKNWKTYKEDRFDMYYSSGTYAGTGAISNCGFGPAAVPSGWTVEHDYKLLARMRARVVGSDFNLASFLGAEGKDTISFLLNTANRIYRAQLAARKLKISEAVAILAQHGRYRPKSRSAVKRAEQEDVYRDLIEAATGRARGQGWWSVPASAWLEYHLAVEPLLGDAVAAAEQLAHITQMPRTQKVSASVRVRVPYPAIYTGAVWTGSREIRKRVVAYFTHTPEPANFMGLKDPELTIWNAIPLSFVADYFYNIGGFLEARATANALPPGTFISTVKDETTLDSCLGYKFQGSWNRVIPLSQSRYSRYKEGSINRTISGSIDVPPPELKPLGAFANWQKATTVCSLIATTFDRGFKLPTGSMR